MRLIRFADLVPTPWKNGGGITTEIAASPAGAGFGDFDWRLSIADVASDGPFSLFAGIDRTLTLIAGNGLVMTIDGGRPLTLTRTSPPLSFPGDVPVSAALVAGPIRDFNVMTRRGRYAHSVTRHDLKTGPAALPSGGTRLVVSLGAGSLGIAGARVTVGFGDVIEAEGPASGSLEGFDGLQDILVVQLTPAG